MIDYCILGSGISGSTIANLLSKSSSVEIIDKARGIGGRCSSKKFTKNLNFDHGLQYFSSKNYKFARFLKKLEKNKILKEWSGNHLDFTFKKKISYSKLIGKKGNNDLNKFLISKIKKKFSTEIIKISNQKNYWELHSKFKTIRSKNLIITFPYPQTKKIAKSYLKKNFNNMKINMVPNITLMISQKGGHDIPISSIKVKGKYISWVANENSKKRFFNKSTLWTVQANEKFSKNIINTFKKKRNYFSNLIMRELAQLLNINNKNFKVFGIHGWKYSYSNNKTSYESYWDKNIRLGICGDWFLGAKAEHAWLSAHSLFKKIKKNPPKN